MIKKLVTLTLVLVTFIIAPMYLSSKTEEPFKENPLFSYNQLSHHPLKELDELKVPYSKTIRVMVTKKDREKVAREVAKMGKEIKMLAQICKVEAGGIKEISHQAAAIWCVLNRVDRDFDDSIKKVITRPGAFAYRSSIKENDHFLWLAEDVLIRWLLEKEGYEDVGRTLGKGYCFFNGKNGYNHYRKEYRSSERWDWSLPTPYET